MAPHASGVSRWLQGTGPTGFFHVSLLLLLTGVIFVLDLLTPRGFTVWMLYLIPLLLTVTSPRARDPLYFAGLFTVLVVLGLLLSPGGEPFGQGLFNRGVGLTVMWAFTLAVTGRRAALVERAQAEAKLRLVEQSIQLMLERASEYAVVMLDAEGRIESWNAAAARVYGYAPGEVLGRPAARLYTPDDLAAGKPGSLLKEAEAGGRCEEEGWRIRKDGTRFWANVILAPVRDEAGGLLGYAQVTRDLTEPRRAQERFRLAVEAAPSGMLMVDGEGRIVLLNRLIEEQFGYRREELLGKPVELLVPERDRTAHLGERERYQAAPSARPMGKGRELYGLRKDGSEFPVEIGLNPIQTTEGVLVLCSVVDITERRRSEEIRRTTEARMAGIVDSAMDAIISIDRDQRIVLFNRAAEQMFRCPASEALGSRIDRFIPARFRDAHREQVRAFGESGVTNRRMGALGTVAGLRADGEEFPAEAAISQIETAQGKLYSVILRDVTERQRAQEALARERDFISAVLDTSAALVVVLDREGRIVRFNRACEQATGYSLEEVKGRAFWDLFLLPEDMEAVKGVFHQLRAGRFPSKHENYWVTKHGARRFISWANSATIGPDGGIEFVIATGLDMTDLRQTQDQLRQTERLAELGTLASGMAHEIGTPMNVILGRAEYLMRRTQEENTRKGLETIVTQVERITKIMNQLLTFARRRPAARRPIHLRQTILDSVDVLQERLRRHGIAVRTSIAPDLPLVEADPDQMSQVLLNLLINALQATPSGGRIEVGAQAGDGVMRIMVSDTGQGIPKEHLEKIFTPFFTTKEIGAGTGLGLTVVHGIIQEHGGRISVESEVGRGTTFTIELPVIKAS